MKKLNEKFKLGKYECKIVLVNDKIPLLGYFLSETSWRMSNCLFIQFDLTSDDLKKVFPNIILGSFNHTPQFKTLKEINELIEYLQLFELKVGDKIQMGINLKNLINTTWFLKQKEKQLSMKKEKRVITPVQAQSIIDSACRDWKERLCLIWAVNIVLKKDIEIAESFYQEMRAACTKEQNLLFDKIFGKDVKVGDKVIVLPGSSYFHQRKIGGIYTIGFLDSNYCRLTNELNEIDDNGYIEQKYVRLATQEDINNYCPYEDGEPIWVLDFNGTWLFRYSNGKRIGGSIQTYQNQKKNGDGAIWDKHMKFDPDNLPVNE